MTKKQIKQIGTKGSTLPGYKPPATRPKPKPSRKTETRQPKLEEILPPEVLKRLPEFVPELIAKSLTPSLVQLTGGYQTPIVSGINAPLASGPISSASPYELGQTAGIYGVTSPTKPQPQNFSLLKDFISPLFRGFKNFAAPTVRQAVGSVVGLAVGAGAGAYGTIASGNLNAADIISNTLEGAVTGGLQTGQAARDLRPPALPTTPIAQTRIPLGTTRTMNGKTWSVVAYDSRGNSVWRMLGAQAPAHKSFIAYLDSLQSVDPQRAAEVARFTAAMENNKSFTDDLGRIRITQAGFEASVFFTERAYLDNNLLPRVATENVWNLISQRQGWGMTGAELLEQWGYTNRGGGVWEYKPKVAVTGYGGGSYSAGPTQYPGIDFGGGGGGFDGTREYSGYGLVMWRI